MTARPLDAAQDALIAVQGQLIVMLAEHNAVLAEQNPSLAAQVADLEERLARLERAASPNSGNSSLPPSMDDQPGRTPPSPQAKRGRGKGLRPGRQPGSPGSHLAWSENPDQTVPLFPRGSCACGADLADAADLGVAASHQQVEIPEMTARVIQHDLHEVACRCGRVHRAPAPPGTGMPGTVSYGTCSPITSPATGPWTPSRASCSPTCPAPSSCTTGTRTTTSCPASSTSSARLHLLRDIEDAAQSYPGAIWPGQIADALRALIHAANTARGQGLDTVPASATAADLRLFRHGVLVGLSQVRRVSGPNQKQPPARLLLECLHDREPDVLRFLPDLRIPPTSNGAERDLRPAKTQQKISGRLRSETTTRHRYAIRGYISTAAKHGISIFTALRDAIAGNPWMPPIPASA